MNRFEENKLLQEELEYKRAELAELERKIKKLGNCYIIFSDGSIDERPINIAHTAINVDCYFQGNVFDSKEEAELEAESISIFLMQIMDILWLHIQIFMNPLTFSVTSKTNLMQSKPSTYSVMKSKNYLLIVSVTR